MRLIFSSGSVGWGSWESAVKVVNIEGANENGFWFSRQCDIP